MLPYRQHLWASVPLGPIARAAVVQVLAGLALLSATERLPNELDKLRKYLTENGLRYEERGSGMARGYAKEKVRLFWIARYEGAAEPAKSKG